MGIQEVKFYVEGLPHPILCRVSGSDIYEYSHLLGRGRSSFNLPIQPEYIVDAGANVGYSVLRFMSDYPVAKIIAIEPEQSNIVQFKKNCSYYSNIVIEHGALWSHSTRLRIESLSAGKNAFRVVEDETSDIEAFSVLDVIERNSLPRIDLLKIDIEGSEKIVFQDTSARDWLRMVRMILIETHDRFEAGCTEAVEKATLEYFDFCGMTGEYRLYLSKDFK
jgi:FkbM family methyltransferase